MPAWAERDMHAALAELALRGEEALTIYRAMETQVAFHASDATIRLMRGGNQSGKSLSCAADFAADAMRRPLHGPDGEPIPRRPLPERPMMFWVIGLGEDHIGGTLHRLLFEPGAFDCIRDAETGLLRAFNPFDPDDEARRAEIEPSPAFIPDRYIKHIAWTNKGSKIFDRVELVNGNTIVAYSSKADVKQGDPVDRIWIDEDIKYPRYVAEWEARLPRRKGRITWSSWPRTANPALMKMSDRAKAQRELPNPDVAEFCLIFSRNPYIEPNEKRKTLDGWAASGPAELRARDLGEFVTDTILMYPNFGEHLHGTPRVRLEQEDDLDRTLRLRGFQPPADWTRYLWLDPGHSYTAVAFLATPPPDFGDYRVLYDELYLQMHDADQCAIAVKQKIAGYWFQSFGIDHRMSRQNIIGGGKTFKQQYAEAFERQGLKSLTTGSDFLPGSDNVAAGILAVRRWLTVQPHGLPILRVVLPTTPHFQEEIRTYRKHIVQEVSQEKPAEGQRDHLMDTLRYAAMHDCPYVPVPDVTDLLPPGQAYESFQRLWVGDKDPNESFTFYCGAGAAPTAA